MTELRDVEATSVLVGGFPLPVTLGRSDILPAAAGWLAVAQLPLNGRLVWVAGRGADRIAALEDLIGRGERHVTRAWAALRN